MDKKELWIDKNNLDEECVWTSSYVDYWSHLETEAAEHLDLMKDNLENTRSIVDVMIRTADKNFLEEQYGWKKEKSLTESAIKALVSLDSDVLEAQEQFNDARRKHREIKSTLQSFIRRHNSLDNLVRLYAVGYFSRVEGKELKEGRSRGLKEKIHKQRTTRKGAQ